MPRFTQFMEVRPQINGMEWNGFHLCIFFIFFFIFVLMPLNI